MEERANISPFKLWSIQTNFSHVSWVCQANLRQISGISSIFQAFLQYVSSVSQAYPRHVSGISQVYLTHISGTSKTFPKQISLINATATATLFCTLHFAAFLLITSQGYLRHISGISQVCLTLIRHISSFSKTNLMYLKSTASYTLCCPLHFGAVLLCLIFLLLFSCFKCGFYAHLRFITPSSLIKESVNENNAPAK